MAGLSSTGIAGFISSAKMTGKQILNAAGKLIPECISTFVSGVSGWIITQKGDAEFKSVYARDKFITNEFVYNRIRVNEDEEIISSSIKIASYAKNEDGTHTVYPDLREGDINPLANDDLLVGYYHNPANSGVIYAIQKFTAKDDPSTEDQSIILEPEGDSMPYQHMIIVRVGNLTDEDRQSFIKISSRTNCQYFFDGINSWAAYDNPEHVKCALGKTDPGLIPSWATSAVGTVKRWFGLIADGVILRGTFVLKNDKTIEQELEGVGTTISALETRFEIKEGQIAASVKEVKTYVSSASDFANDAAGSATAAGGILKTVQECEASINVTAQGIASKVSEITTQVDAATDVLDSITKKEASINLTAKGIESKVSEITTQVDAATDVLDSITEKESSINQTAKGVVAVATEVSKMKTEVVNKYAEMKLTADGFQTTVTETTKKAVDAAVAGADANIEEKVSTQVTQSAREWKIEVMGADEQGNPNQILAAINASKEGIKIKGDKVEIDGTLLANIIKATGLNVNDNFIVAQNGEVNLKGRISTSFEGKRIDINPQSNSIFMYNENGHVVTEISFISSSHSGENPLSISQIFLYNRSVDGTILPSSLLQSDAYILESMKFSDTTKVIIGSRGITFYKNGSVIKEL